MAPSRRKGTSKAAAAATRRKWEVGDLVLAKVKGFPAWPATVSEPQKWGQPADLKKVLVFFFGTQQIAFCSHADIEEFTEEKKMSLLGKRHGKGSDFARALREIVDCFEKLKKQDQVTSDNLTEETVTTNENNSDESLTRSVNDEAAVITLKQLSGGANDDLNSLTEAAVAAAAAEDALHEEGMQPEEAHSNSGFTEIHVYKTRSKTDAAQSRNIGQQRRISARKLRSSSRVDVGRLQKLMLPPTSNHRNSRRLGANAQDRSLRSRRIIKSSNDSEGNNANSPLFQSNGSVDENDSEIMTADSDSDSLNDDSSVDSGCKPVEEEPFTEMNEGETELSDRLDFHTNANIIKKKRKPNRKRHRSDLVVKLNEVVSETKVLKTDCISPCNNEKKHRSDLVVKLDELVSETEVLKTDCISPSSNNEKVAERCLKEDSDEHLPLSKRARVRLGKSSPVGDEEIKLAHDEEKPVEVTETPKKSYGALNTTLHVPLDREAILIKGDLDILPLLHGSPDKKPQNWETRKIFVDGEAALPPSKRLHRALEAMSANAAEHSQRASSCSPKNTPNEGCSSEKCSELSTEENTVIELGTGSAGDFSTSVSLPNASGSCFGLNMEVPEKHGETDEMVLDSCRTSDDGSSFPELGKDSFEHAESVCSKRLKLSPVNECPDFVHQHLNPDLPNIPEKDASHLDCNRPCLISSPNGRNIKPSVLKDTAKRTDADMPPMNSDSLLVEEITGDSLDTEKCRHIDHADGDGESLSENQDGQRSEVIREARLACADPDVIREARLTCADSPVKVLSNSRLEDTVVSVAQSSSHVTDRPESVAKSSPPSSSVCCISSSDSYVEKKSSNSNAQLHLEKAKLVGKSSSKMELFSSFETVIRSLTRTKESIGRATRIAIDCAKLGFAAKVVELLAHNLESESSPHKKVDLFFLVDSITQCSGGMKGDAGVYPSAIQAVLPRLLLAAAPSGTGFLENHRQCSKVLKVWLERKILPETLIRHHMRELDSLYRSHVNGGSRRSCKFERPFDDPIREMGGMLVDEYGSNSSIQLPGFRMPPMLRDDDIGSDSDGENFEAVTPEHNMEHVQVDGEPTVTALVEKRSHILEDVDGELEMEDVAPSCDIEVTSVSNIAGTDCTQEQHNQFDSHYGAPFAAHQSKDTHPPPPPPPPPHSPLPPPPPPPPAQPHPLSGFPPAVLNSASKFSHSNSQEPTVRRSPSPRTKPRTLDMVHHRNHNHKDSEAHHLPRQMSYCSNNRSFSDQRTSHFSDRSSNGFQPVDGAFSKGFHLPPPHLAPSDQFSYVQEPRIQSRRDIPPPHHPNRYPSRSTENGNFYRDRDRYKFGQRDNIGEHWRPRLPSVSGPYHYDDSRMAHAHMPYPDPVRETAVSNNRWNYPPRSMNHRQFNPYGPPSEGPIPVANKGPNFWKPR